MTAECSTSQSGKEDSHGINNKDKISLGLNVTNSQDFMRKDFSKDQNKNKGADNDHEHDHDHPAPVIDNLYS
jgi:hypothetical protein